VNSQFSSPENAKSIRHGIYKTPDWKNATIKSLHNGKAVLVPIKYNKNLFLKVSEDKNDFISLNSLSYLLISTNKKNDKVIEWVTFIPTNSNNYQKNGNKFRGKVIIENWNGNFKKAYLFENDGKIYHLKLENQNNNSVKTLSDGIKVAGTYCFQQPWYGENIADGESYWYLGGYDTYCFSTGNSYNEQTHAENEVGGGHSEVIPEDYQPPLINEEIFDIRFTKAFKNDLKLQCIFGKLVIISANWKNSSSPFISNLLANFTLNDDIVYDLRSLGSGINGQTTKPSSNTYYSTINQDNYSNRTSLLVAKTLVHETIHANILRSLNYATSKGGFYEDLIKYKIADPNVSANISHHEYMVDKYINPIAGFLAEYDNNSHSLDYYISLAWEGLHETSAYNQLTNSQKSKISNDLSNELQKTNKNCN
ncbi:hypothetical protein, partial [Pedobacter alpinus]